MNHIFIWYCAHKFCGAGVIPALTFPLSQNTLQLRSPGKRKMLMRLSLPQRAERWAPCKAELCLRTCFLTNTNPQQLQSQKVKPTNSPTPINHAHLGWIRYLTHAWGVAHPS